jgi:hypothetical protein
MAPTDDIYKKNGKVIAVVPTNDSYNKEITVVSGTVNVNSDGSYSMSEDYATDGKNPKIVNKGSGPKLTPLPSDGTSTQDGWKKTPVEKEPSESQTVEAVKEVTGPAVAISETAAVITHTGELMDEAAEVAAGAKGVSVAARALGGVAGGLGLAGAALDTIDAAIDMSKNGLTWSNGTQMALGIASGILLATPLGEAYQTITTIVSACTVANDFITIATKE